MRKDILVPKLGLTMEEGVLVEWAVKPGERFEAGQTLFIIESEKAAVEVPAEGDGVLVECRAPSSDALPVGTVIGQWEEGSHPHPSPLPPAGEGAVRIPVTPLARRLAAERGIDLGGVQGSGPRGRIRARDLPEAGEAAPARAAPATAPATPPASASAAAAAHAPGSLRAPTPAEQTIARRLVQSKREIPHFYLAREVDASRLIALREELRAAQPRQRYTLNHFFLAAVGRALEDLPQANRVWTQEGIRTLATSDVAMAVNTERGLLAPVLRGVGSLTFLELAAQADAAAAQARNGRLSAQAMEGGAITVSNAGMHDVTWMGSIIPPSQAMILGVGSVRELFRPDAAGQPELKREIGLMLSADHRVLEGVSALQFLKQVAGYLEQPLRLLLR